MNRDTSIEYFTEALLRTGDGWEWSDVVGLLIEGGWTEYFIRRLSGGSRTGSETFEIAKFVQGSKRPLEIYKVERHRNSWVCDCPGFRREVTTKHIDMIQDWLLKGEPVHPMLDPTDIRKDVRRFAKGLRRQ